MRDIPTTVTGRFGVQSYSLPVSPNCLQENRMTLINKVTIESGIEEKVRCNSGVIHDVNNLLGVIGGLAALLADELPEGQTAHARIVNILHAVNHCGNLLSTLRPDTFHLDAARHCFTINTLIEECVAMIRLLERPVSISESIRGTANTAVYGSESELGAALMNLCLNAVEALPDGAAGIVEIRTSLIEYGEESVLAEKCPVTAAGHIRIEISDNGPGIPPDTLHHIFDPFFSSKPTTGGKRRGLGLYRVHQCAVAHGGAVSATSAIGEGTTFTLLLPIAAGGQQTGTESVPHNDGMNLMRKVVVIDEDDDACDHIASIFGLAGVEVVRHSDPRTAISWVAEHVGQASVAIIEKNHRNGDGMASINALKSIDHDMKFILYSRCRDYDCAAVTGSGIEFLRKPFLKQDLISAVDRVLKRKDCAG